MQLDLRTLILPLPPIITLGSLKRKTSLLLLLPILGQLYSDRVISIPHILAYLELANHYYRGPKKGTLNAIPFIIMTGTSQSLVHISMDGGIKYKI